MISHHHRCIFVHIPKCAGTSIEAAFVADLGMEFEHRAPLLLRDNDDPALGPPRLEHLRAVEYREFGYAPDWMMRDYFSFAVVRNPWSRAVSLYHYAGTRAPFRRFACEQLPKRGWAEWFWFVRPQIDFVLDADGTLLVDRLFATETLARDYAELRDIVGLRTELPSCNVAQRGDAVIRRGQGQLNPDRKARRRWFAGKRRTPPKEPQWFAHWRDYYDAESRAAIAELYAADIAYLGYSFEKDARTPV